jgi:hypothetical protein
MTIRSNALIDFYSGRSPDFRGRMIDDIWAMSFDDLEYTHDFIQWLFPLRERSAVQPNVPVLDDATIAEFDSAEMRDRLRRSAEVMAAFYGFVIDGTRVDLAPNAVERQANWLTRGNHNFLRLTRIMKSLATLALPDLAAGWLDILSRVYADNQRIIGADTWRYWQSAPLVRSSAE